MAGVEEELWNIFTFYTLRGNPLDLARLSATQFLRLARDCQIIDGGRADIEEVLQQRTPSPTACRSQQQRLFGNRRLVQAAVSLTFASIIQGRSKVASGDRGYRKHRILARTSTVAADYAAVKSKLTYPEFLDALAVLGERMYGNGVQAGLRPPPAECRSSATDGGSCDRAAVVESTLQQLLMEHILPLASRRRPGSISSAIDDPLVRDLLRCYGPALREIFRFYAMSSSATKINSSRNDSDSGSGSGGVSRGGNGSGSCSGGSDNNRNAVPQPPSDGVGERCLQPPTASVPDPAAPLPEPPTAAADAPRDAGPSPNTTTTAAASAASTSRSLPVPNKRNAPAGDTTADTGMDTSATAAIPQATPPARASGCPLSPQKGTTSAPEVKASGDANDGGRHAADGGRGGRRSDQRRSRHRAQSSQSSQQSTQQSSSASARAATMNSMADALSHECLLHFAADFGISGALCSALEVGDVFLSCDGRLADAFYGGRHVQDGTHSAAGNHRIGLARAGKGHVRPLTFPEFLEALVRISLACFRPRGGAVSETQECSRKGPVAAGQCLRALLAHMWRKLHDSAELALNGVRVGGARHRSSIQKGALMKGVKLFNEKMLSRWRNEGFLDFASIDAAAGITAPFGIALRTPRPGHAAEMLRGLLGVDDGRTGDAANTRAGGGGSSLLRHCKQEVGEGKGGVGAVNHAPKASESRRVTVDARSS